MIHKIDLINYKKKCDMAAFKDLVNEEKNVKEKT